MRSLVRAVQCIKSSQKYRLLDRELPSKVSISERKKEGVSLVQEGRRLL